MYVQHITTTSLCGTTYQREDVVAERRAALRREAGFHQVEAMEYLVTFRGKKLDGKYLLVHGMAACTREHKEVYAHI